MKKWILAAGFMISVTACNEGLRSDENNSDSTDVLINNPAPVGDSSNRMNTKEYSGDTSNQNADDSVKGTNPASRRTTPRNTGAGNKE